MKKSNVRHLFSIVLCHVKEYWLRHEHFQQKAGADILYLRLRFFLESQNIEEWEEYIRCILPLHINSFDFRTNLTLSPEEVKQIRDLYNNMPSACVVALDEFVREVLAVSVGNVTQFDWDNIVSNARSLIFILRGKENNKCESIEKLGEPDFTNIWGL